MKKVIAYVYSDGEAINAGKCIDSFMQKGDYRLDMTAYAGFMMKMINRDWEDGDWFRKGVLGTVSTGGIHSVCKTILSEEQIKAESRLLLDRYPSMLTGHDFLLKLTGLCRLLAPMAIVNSFNSAAAFRQKDIGGNLHVGYVGNQFEAENLRDRWGAQFIYLGGKDFSPSNVLADLCSKKGIAPNSAFKLEQIIEPPKDFSFEWGGLP